MKKIWLFILNKLLPKGYEINKYKINMADELSYLTVNNIPKEVSYEGDEKSLFKHKPFDDIEKVENNGRFKILSLRNDGCMTYQKNTSKYKFENK